MTYIHVITGKSLQAFAIIQWVSVIRTSLGIAYNVLITGMSDTMDIAYKNTLGSRKYVRITYLHYLCIYMRTIFRRWFLYPVCFISDVHRGFL